MTNWISWVSEWDQDTYSLIQAKGERPPDLFGQGIRHGPWYQLCEAVQEDGAPILTDFEKMGVHLCGWVLRQLGLYFDPQYTLELLRTPVWRVFGKGMVFTLAIGKDNLRVYCYDQWRLPDLVTELNKFHRTKMGCQLDTVTRTEQVDGVARQRIGTCLTIERSSTEWTGLRLPDLPPYRDPRFEYVLDIPEGGAYRIGMDRDGYCLLTARDQATLDALQKLFPEGEPHYYFGCLELRLPERNP